MGMMRSSTWLVLFSVTATGCRSQPPLPEEAHFEVTSQVVDSRTGQPARARPDPASASLPGSLSQAVLRKLEPAPELEQDAEKPAAAPPRSPEEEVLLSVARERPFVPVDTRVNGQPVVMNFVGGDDRCRTVAVTYTTQWVAELWRICADGQFSLDREAEPIPALSNDPALLATRQATVHRAYADGRAVSPYGELMVKAQSSGQPDANGCMMIRSAVSWNGVTIGMNDETVCSYSE